MWNAIIWSQSDCYAALARFRLLKLSNIVIGRRIKKLEKDATILVEPVVVDGAIDSSKSFIDVSRRR